MRPKEKQFKDPVHGYISVPEDWCTDFIDMQIFQRLRHIEQTSMRPLYPAAHHDRFIHSLGTYHLGCQMLLHLDQNTEDPQILEFLGREQVRNTFLMACLMHDCGHAPFSHTFEGFYNYTEAKTAKRAYEELAKEFPNSDFKVEGSFDPAPHEAFSAVVLSRLYKTQIKKHGCDPELAARMITGCTYPDERDTEKSFLNSLISLLNGKAIDVDKLDYILRDTWASGVQNVAIDIDRLVSSVELRADATGKVQLCYRKSALSVLQNVVDARNYLYEWVYNHHTVLYYAKLLNRSLKKLAKYLATDGDPDFFWKTVFSLDPFQQHMDLGHNAKVYLPTDGDMLHLLKRFAREASLPYIDELLSHATTRIAMWKTSAEFRMLFKGAPVTEPEICESVADKLMELLESEMHCAQGDIVVASAHAKQYVIMESHVHVLMDGQSKPFTEVMGDQPQRRPGNFFYVYVPTALESRRQDIINIIKAQTR